MTTNEWMTGDFWYHYKVKWLRPKTDVNIYIWEHRHESGTMKNHYSVSVECSGFTVVIAEELPTVEEAMYFVENNLEKILFACDYVRYGQQVLHFLNPKFKPETTKKKTDESIS